jgi:hypothetical protein
MMTRDQWRWWLELIVGLSVVISLFVLIAEVRTNTAAVERQSRLDQISILSQPFLDDVELGVVLAKIKAVDGREAMVSALMNAYDLTDVEAASWARHLYSLWGTIEVDYLYSRTDLVEHNIRALIDFPDARMYWENNRQFHSEKFVEFIDEILKELDSED